MNFTIFCLDFRFLLEDTVSDCSTFCEILLNFLQVHHFYQKYFFFCFGTGLVVSNGASLAIAPLRWFGFI